MTPTSPVGRQWHAPFPPAPASSSLSGAWSRATRAVRARTIREGAIGLFEPAPIESFMPILVTDIVFAQRHMGIIRDYSRPPI